MMQSQVVYSESLKVTSEEFKAGNFLYWVTLSENNSKTFFVERSVNGVEFESIAEIDAAGISNKEITYRYLDIQGTDKVLYYRLRQEDRYGIESTTPILTVERKLDNNFMIADFTENPLRDYCQVTLQIFQPGEMKYMIETYKGDTIYNSMRMVNEGLNEFDFNFSDKKPGRYAIRFKMGDEEERLNMIKVEN